ncbi:MAG: response regulator [Campylobacterales bacterium]|nr:response regulator [Campylobacterales bacterium]
MHSVVIVEDELIAAEYLKNILQNGGYDVCDIINNGKDALKKIPTINPDIVLMDIMLKDSISGSEVALQLKSIAPDIAIIFLTAYTDNEMIDYAIDSNCYGYIVKPYNEKEILANIKIALAKKRENSYDKKTDIMRYQLAKNIYFDMELKRLIRDEKEIKLNNRQILLLDLLCKTPSRTVTNDILSLALWGEVINPITLRTFMHRLKKIIGKDIIQNTNRLGYMIVLYKEKD